ncbi:MAG TPA: hypothetical protein VGQ72_14405 [Pyrinomonadaceae bacterium]|nr:hypothetical protein [Pyrinomonadaceae bacterium]
MKNLRRRRSVLAAMFFALAVLLALPAMSFAQGRGRGRGRGADLSWKCGKFVNCHDARNGRWDGRGPRGSRVGIFRNRRVNNGVIFFPRGRNRRVDRDGDGDFDRNDVLLGRMRRHGRGRP